MSFQAQAGDVLFGVHAIEAEGPNAIHQVGDTLERRMAAHETAMLLANQDLAEAKASQATAVVVQMGTVRRGKISCSQVIPRSRGDEADGGWRMGVHHDHVV